MGQKANVVSLSGGKDSTAMLIMMLERDEPIADIVFFDTGWEFPQMYEHLECLERYIGRKITRLRPRLPVSVVTDKTPLDWMFSEYPVVKRGTSQPHMIGRGWPAPMRAGVRDASRSLYGRIYWRSRTGRIFPSPCNNVLALPPTKCTAWMAPPKRTAPIMCSGIR